MDILEKCQKFVRAREAMAAGYYPYYLPFTGHDGTICQLAGRELVMCGSNNYLGLTTDRRVTEASRAALERYGSSCTGSRLLNGNLWLHDELERRLAAFFGKPAALVFSTGYHANVGTMSALLAPGDVVFVDREAHASVIDGCRMAQARVRSFAHNDPAHLRAKLAKCPAGVGKLVVVDGVYSMSGDICPLPEIAEVCAQFGARLVVDDAHGAGVLAGGRGTSALFGLTDRVDLITITFSKAFASLGGAVLGSEQVIHYLRHHARSQIFSASITPANAAAALRALEIVADEPWRCQRALDNARHIGGQLRQLGLDVGDSQSPIVPVHTGDPITTVVAWRRLLELGVYANAIVPPAGSPRLRTSFMATHEQRHLDRVVAAFATLADEAGAVAPRSDEMGADGIGAAGIGAAGIGAAGAMANAAGSAA
jgi:8-amino-7-oxononanoate synthase